MCVCVCSFQNSGTLFFSLKRSQGNAKLKVTTSNCIENFIIISPWRSVLNLRKDSQFKRLLQFDILICTTWMILEVRMKRPMWQGRREGAILEQNWGYQEEAIYNLSDSRVTFSNQSYIHAWKCMEVDGGFNFYTKVVPSLRHSGFISRLLPPSFHSLHADCDISVLELSRGGVGKGASTDFQTRVTCLEMNGGFNFYTEWSLVSDIVFSFLGCFHPVFIACMQTVISQCWNTDKGTWYHTPTTQV